MPRYSQEVVEIRTVSCFYVVEAESLDEAKELIENGDTIKEIEFTNTQAVSSRLPQGEPTIEPTATGPAPGTGAKDSKALVEVMLFDDQGQFRFEREIVLTAPSMRSPKALVDAVLERIDDEALQAGSCSAILRNQSINSLDDPLSREVRIPAASFREYILNGILKTPIEGFVAAKGAKLAPDDDGAGPSP